MTISRKASYLNINCNWNRNQNHLVLKRTLNHLAKLEVMLVFRTHCLGIYKWIFIFLEEPLRFTNACCSLIRSSHRRCSIKISVLKTFAKFTGKHLCRSLSLNKVAGLNPAALFKKRL